MAIKITMGLILLTISVTGTMAQGINLRCPVEGLFDAPREIGDHANPAAGWRLFLEGKPQVVELVPPSTPEGMWLITCHLAVGGALVPLNAYMSGSKKCHLSANGGSVVTLKNGGLSCTLTTGDDSCLINCR
jgi:hypothetical protein